MRRSIVHSAQSIVVAYYDNFHIDLVVGKCVGQITVGRSLAYYIVSRQLKLSKCSIVRSLSFLYCSLNFLSHLASACWVLEEFDLFGFLYHVFEYPTKNQSLQYADLQG
jgi:hypothetical protein